MGRCFSSPSTFDSKYILGEQIGAGAAARIHSVVEICAPHQTFAVKILNGQCRWQDDNGHEQTSFDKDWLRTAQQEAQAMLRLGQHAYCIELREIFAEAKTYYLVMEKCMESLMDRHERMPLGILPEDQISKTFREMLLGIKYVHSVGMVHRDIKPENFLFAEPETPQMQQRLKLCDFGTSLIMTGREGLLKEMTGTALYMSPEMIGMKGYSKETDVWSMGVTSYLLVYGSFPYIPKEDTWESTLHTIYGGVPAPTFSPNVARGFKEASVCTTQFIQTLLHRSSLTRCSASRAIELPLIKSHL